MSDVKYVYIEAIAKKDAKYDVVAGLFRGIIERSGDKFILLSGIDKGQTNILNLRYFNIMSMEVLEPVYKNMFYLTSTEEDQVTGLKILTEHYDKLVKDGIVIESDPSIIDTNKYVDVPKEYLELVKAKPNSNVSIVQNTNNVGGFPNNRIYTSNYKAPEKKEIVPICFGRSDGKKPTPATLLVMAEKMDLVASGEFVVSFPDLVESGEIVAAGAKSYDGEGTYHNKHYSYMNGAYD